MKHKRTFVIAAFCLLVCRTATAQKVSVDWDKSVNFSTFKTYAYLQGTPTPNQLMDQRIVNGIEQQLMLKGLQKVDVNANPDLIVSYQAAAGSQTQVNTTGTGGWGWGYRWGGGMSTTTVSQIPTGMLAVNIGDAKTHKLLWLGDARDTLSDNPEKNTKKINKALEKMFKKYPPPSK